MIKEEEIQEAIQKEKQRLETLIADAMKSEKSFDDRITTQYNKKNIAIKDFEIALEKASKPYDDAIATMEKEREAVQHRKYTMQILMNTTEARIRAKFAEKLPEFPDAMSLKGYLLSKDIHTPDVKMIKTKLPNGITLFTAYRNYYLTSANKSGSSKSDEVAYFAVKGKDFIGYIFTQKSKHPGDTATVYCWMNSQYLRDKTQLSKNEYGIHPTVGFKKWKQMVSELKTFVAIDLDDEKNKKVLEFATQFVEHDAMKD